MNDPHPEFTKALWATYNTAVREAKYQAPYFRRMLLDNFGFDTACQLITSPNATTGFTHMYENDRLDLTVEAVVIQPQWSGLFEKEVLSAAHKRLKDCRYAFPPNAWNPNMQDSPRATPVASDTDEDAERFLQQTYRILRDTEIARRVKKVNDYKCQLCGHRITLANGDFYAEAHHIKPLGQPHNGPDRIDNLVCLCPNHHAELDYGVIPLALDGLRKAPGHAIDREFVEYHNKTIFRKIK